MNFKLSEWTPLSKTNSKLIYESWLKKITKPPTSINTWITIYPFLEQFNWTDTFILPYKVLREAHLQSFQYKILNRIINCIPRRKSEILWIQYSHAAATEISFWTR